MDLFRVGLGIEIESANLASKADILQGSGAPGADSGIQDAAPIGSLYLRTDAVANNLQLYVKVASTNSASDWKAQTTKEYVDAVVQGLSWREPVVANDTALYADASAFPVSGTVDTVVLADLDRVLFSNVTLAGDNNVFVWHSGTSTWTEDTNAESAGDALLVTNGTKADQQWVYSGVTSGWVQLTNATSLAELAYIRTFIGKSAAGSITPTYSSTEVVTPGTSLQTAVGALDAAIGTGNIVNTGGNYAVTSDGTWAPSPGSNTITGLVDNLNAAIGDRSYTLNNVVTDGEAVAVSVEKLDLAVGVLQNNTLVISGTNVAASSTVVDSIDVTAASEMLWMIQVRENATPTKRRSNEVHAMSDGTSVDHTTYAGLTLGGAIAGFAITVDVSGGLMRLKLSATNNVDYVVKRVAFSAF